MARDAAPPKDLFSDTHVGFSDVEHPLPPKIDIYGRAKTSFDLVNGEEIASMIFRSVMHRPDAAWFAFLKKMNSNEFTVSRGRCTVDGGQIYCEFVIDNFLMPVFYKPIDGIRISASAGDLDIKNVQRWDVRGNTLFVTRGG